jgi:hypothetical protein
MDASPARVCGNLGSRGATFARVTSALITRHTECPPDTICCTLAEELSKPINSTDVVLRRLNLAKKIPQGQGTPVRLRVVKTG